LMVHGITTPSIALGGVAHALADRGCRVMLFDLYVSSQPLSPQLSLGPGRLLTYNA
jgi:hypothetical protein